MTYPDGTGRQYGADDDGQILLVSDLTGRVIEKHEYDSEGRGTTSEIGDGREKYTLEYEPGVTTVTDALGNVTRYEWQEFGEAKRVTKIVGPCSSCGSGGEVEERTYDDDGRLLTTKNGLDEETVYHYEPDGDLDWRKDPSGRMWNYTYDDQGRVLTATDPAGAEVVVTHGPAGPLTFEDQVHHTTTFTYETGKLETIVNPLDKTTTLGYNEFGDLTSIVDPLSHGITMEYDAMGRRTRVTNGVGKHTDFSYDLRGRLKQITGHDGTKTSFAYDSAGRLETVTDALGRTSRSAYDAYGRLSTVLDPLRGATHYRYDLMSRLVGLSDAEGRETVFRYDGYGRLDRTTYPDGTFDAYTYDGAGRLKTRTDRKQVTTTSNYDLAGRLLGWTFSDGTPPVSYTYDAAGRLWTATNAADALTFEYYDDGRIKNEQSTHNASTVAYTYDWASRRQTLSLDGQPWLVYGHDDAGRLTSLTRDAQVFGFGYDDANGRTSLDYPNGVTTTYEYDDLSRLTSLRALHGTDTVMDVLYGLDAAGERTSKTTPGMVERYVYDGYSRLTQVDRTGTQAQTWSFGYDRVGNRVHEQADSAAVTSQYDNRNQLLSRQAGGQLLWRGSLSEPGTVKITSATVNGKPARMLPGNVFEATIDATPGANAVTLQATDDSGNVRTSQYSVDVVGEAASYTYDANGQLETKSIGGHLWAYEWDALGQLSRVTRDGAEVARFVYDALGRRLEKVAGGVTYGFTYDGADVLRETRTGGVVLTFVHGPGIDEPLAQQDGSGVVTYYHADGLASVVSVTDQAGQVTLARQYDAWGNQEVGASEPGYAFTGREWDPEIGLYYYRARYYDPKVGRFISEDPIGFAGGINAYSYGGANPVVAVDPFGLKARVCRDGDTIRVELKVRYKNAPPEFQSQFESSVEQTWTGQFGSYNVETTVVPGKDNTVEYGASATKVRVSGSTMYWGDPPLNGNPLGGNPPIPSDQQQSVIAHEAGHLMNLDDGYNPKTGLPLEGRDDVMARIYGPVRERLIEELVRKNKVKPCTCQ